MYIWGWNESGQLALPCRSLAEEGQTMAGDGEAQLWRTVLAFLTPGRRPA